MRIVHFSDIHIGGLPRGYSFLSDKRILGTLNFLIRRRLKQNPHLLEQAIAVIKTLAPDCVVCTGDITCVGSPEEFAAAISALRPLAMECPWTFVYIPGNHDSYVKNPACKSALEHAFFDLNNGRWQLDDLPRELSIDGVKLFAVNQCAPTNWLLSSGALSVPAQKCLMDWLTPPRSDGEKRILIGHFPLRNCDGKAYSWRRRLVDSDPILAALDDGQLDVLLCGHEHSPFIRTNDNGGMEICAGALTTYGKFSVLDYAPSSGHFSQFWVDLLSDTPVPFPLANSPMPATR